MQTTTVNNLLSVTGQVHTAEVAGVAKGGFKSIICNRPDGESADQPSFAEINAAAEKSGLEARYIPIVSGGETNADAVAFAKAMAEMPGPVLAFCRTGNRSLMMWRKSQRLKEVDSNSPP